jgi:hypothetical protein
MFASLAVAGSQAGAQQSGTPVYTTYMYSDATLTEQVGIITGQCSYRGEVQYSLYGTYTYHQVDELVFYCSGGQPTPIE